MVSIAILFWNIKSPHAAVHIQPGRLTHRISNPDVVRGKKNESVVAASVHYD